MTTFREDAASFTALVFLYGLFSMVFFLEMKAFSMLLFSFAYLFVGALLMNKVEDLR